jgi:glycerol-3-phosphate dehydrogenase
MKRNLGHLSRHVYDVLVIGGGIYGVCTAWDAASCGLSVALVEKGDFGHATSSNTLRVIHGGLRYLQHADIRRIRRSIHERSVLMQIAPHLVHPLPFLIPTYGHGMRGKEIFSLALRMNNLIGIDRNCLQDPGKYLPAGQLISKEECLRLFPGVEERGLTGGAIYYDCQMSNSERLILAFVRSAAQVGAEMANYVEATGFLIEQGHVIGVKARDVLTGERLDVQARVVVNTSGPWVGQVWGLLNGHHPNRRIALSKACNLLINRQLVPQYAVGIYSRGAFKDQDAIVSKGYRLFFLTPWHGRSLIGTVHLPSHTDPDGLTVSEAEIQAFVDEINAAYPAAELKRQDVCFAYWGLLPAAGYGAGEVQLVKHYRLYDHQKEDGINGLISVIGVKFTEARYVAEKTVNLVFRKLGKKPPQSTTAISPLYGGQIEQFDAFLSQEAQREPLGLSAETLHYLICQYGSAYREVLKYLDGDLASVQPTATNPSAEYSRWSEGSLSLMKAEILHGIQEEMAQKLADVIFRRTPLGMAGDPGYAYLRTCATIMAEELGWGETRTRREIDEVRTIFAQRLAE